MQAFLSLLSSEICGSSGNSWHWRIGCSGHWIEAVRRALEICPDVSSNGTEMGAKIGLDIWVSEGCWPLESSLQGLGTVVQSSVCPISSRWIFFPFPFIEAN